MMSTRELLYLSEKTLQSLNISTMEVVESMEKLIIGQVTGQVWATPKSVILPGDGRYMMSTLSSADSPPYLAVKSVILNPRNTEQGLPQINGLIMVLDSETGVPVAVVDGNWVTAIRTAGASAVAARRLARKDASVMAFIGCGVQAQSHLKLFTDLFPLKQVRAFGRGSVNRDALCDYAHSLGLESVSCESGEEAVKEADIVITSVTMTAAIEPFIDPRNLKPGVFVSATDIAIPLKPEGMSAFDQIIIDDKEQEAAMEKPMVEASLISGDVNELVAGKIPGRENDEERTAFIFRAVVLGDLALSGLALDKAREESKGQILQ